MEFSLACEESGGGQTENRQSHHFQVSFPSRCGGGAVGTSQTLWILQMCLSDSSLQDNLQPDFVHFSPPISPVLAWFVPSRVLWRDVGGHALIRSAICRCKMASYFGSMVRLYFGLFFFKVKELFQRAVCRHYWRWRRDNHQMQEFECDFRCIFPITLLVWMFLCFQVKLTTPEKIVLYHFQTKVLSLREKKVKRPSLWQDILSCVLTMSPSPFKVQSV